MSEGAELAYARWSRLHGGLDPRTSVWVAGWVRLTHACARPLARRGVRPDVVTVGGVAVAAGVPALVSLGAAWPLPATALLVLAVVLDGVDGALASQTGTDTAWGRVLDPLADRCSDLLLILAVVLLGAPAWLGVALAVLTLLLESVRASAQVAGMSGPGVVTLWERPARAITVGAAAVLCGSEWLVRRVDVDLLGVLDAPLLATTAGAAGLLLAVVGLTQLLVAVHRQLRPPAPPGRPRSAPKA